MNKLPPRETPEIVELINWELLTAPAAIMPVVMTPTLLVETSVPIPEGIVWEVPPVFVIIPIDGDVSVLFVNVSAPVKVAKSSSLNAVLNCATVPVKVLFARLIDLFVRVCISVVPTISPDGACLPSTVSAFKFGTFVVERTTNGAVPCSAWDSICPFTDNL